MKKVNTYLLKHVVFKNWINSGYAIFCTLKKQVKIAVLPVIYTFLIHHNAVAQADTIQLEEITIASSRIPMEYLENSSVITIIDKAEIAELPVLHVHDLLNYAMGVDLRQRGTHGVQSDVNIRGGTFEQAMVLLNGIKLNDPQSGHHNLNLPLDLESIERIEIIRGPGARIFGPSAFTGAINIITKDAKQKFIKAQLGAGQYAFRNGNFASAYQFNKIHNYFSYAFKKTDGYTDNTDFEHSSLYYQVKTNGKWGNVFAMAGYSTKNFGANSFYTPAYPEQFEKTKTLFSAVKYTKQVKLFKIMPTIYWRRHQDHFRLERTNPGFYTNNHLTNVYGADLSVSVASQFGVSAIGFEYRQEQIFSNSLGEPMTDSLAVPGENGFYFTREKKRDDIRFYTQHNADINQFSVDFGLISYYNSDFGWDIFPGLNASYQMNKSINAFLGYNYSFRVPTFTELYYSSPTNKGNLDLQPEISSTIDIGMKYYHDFIFSQFSVFYRDGQDLIDWALDSSGIWISRNVNDIHAYGFEFELKLYFDQLKTDIPLLKSMKANYAYLDLDKSSGIYTSFYILDYLKHKFVLQSGFSITKKTGFSLVYNFQDRAGTYIDFQSGNEKDYQPFNTFDVNLYWRNTRFKVYFFVNNLFNQEYADLANIPMPGRWIKFGLKYNLPL